MMRQAVALTGQRAAQRIIVVRGPCPAQPTGTIMRSSSAGMRWRRSFRLCRQLQCRKETTEDAHCEPDKVPQT